MEVRIRCKVKNLRLHELNRSIAQNEVADFTSVEYEKSISLRTAIRAKWVEVLKKAKTAVPKPKQEVEEKSRPEEKSKGKKRGRKPKSAQTA